MPIGSGCFPLRCVRGWTAKTRGFVSDRDVSVTDRKTSVIFQAPDSSLCRVIRGRTSVTCPVEMVRPTRERHVGCRTTESMRAIGFPAASRTTTCWAVSRPGTLPDKLPISRFPSSERLIRRSAPMRSVSLPCSVRARAKNASTPNSTAPKANCRRRPEKRMTRREDKVQGRFDTGISTQAFRNSACVRSALYACTNIPWFSRWLPERTPRPSPPGWKVCLRSRRHGRFGQAAPAARCPCAPFCQASWCP